ncbi:PREDICTED: uncharacterized protein LOC106809883, partial [Priapulus caudatus]|uniref:Uncharacterized protein LOC106809883 n=1 Tax=Priapulus caudatus TaxID=37621 RepID=A0ABM1E8T4_PRICU
NHLRSGLRITTTCQCIEELVSNAIDAKATCIAVRVDLDTFKLQVVDNGIGISESDLSLLGHRYATSKCKSLQDLSSVSTFGFRGESIASIANVSKKLQVVSRYIDTADVFQKCFTGGQSSCVELCSSGRPSHGTTVTVEGLFHEAPVRRLRIVPALAFPRMRKLLECIALMHPHVSFSLRNDASGEVCMKTRKNASVLGVFTELFDEVAASLLREVNYCCCPFELYGHVGRNGRPRKDQQWLYVNKRPVEKTRVHSFINRFWQKTVHGSRSTMPPGGDTCCKSSRDNAAYPVYILNISCPLDEVDVTSVSETHSVEFKNWETVLECIRKALKQVWQKENVGSGDMQESEGLLQEVLLLQSETVNNENESTSKRALNKHSCLDEKDDEYVNSLQSLQSKIVHRPIKRLAKVNEVLASPPAMKKRCLSTPKLFHKSGDAEHQEEEKKYRGCCDTLKSQRSHLRQSHKQILSEIALDISKVFPRLKIRDKDTSPKKCLSRGLSRLRARKSAVNINSVSNEEELHRGRIFAAYQISHSKGSGITPTCNRNNVIQGDGSFSQLHPVSTGMNHISSLTKLRSLRRSAQATDRSTPTLHVQGIVSPSHGGSHTLPSCKLNHKLKKPISIYDKYNTVLLNNKSNKGSKATTVRKNVPENECNQNGYEHQKTKLISPNIKTSSDMACKESPAHVQHVKPNVVPLRNETSHCRLRFQEDSTSDDRMLGFYTSCCDYPASTDPLRLVEVEHLGCNCESSIEKSWDYGVPADVDFNSLTPTQNELSLANAKIGISRCPCDKADCKEFAFDKKLSICTFVPNVDIAAELGPIDCSSSLNSHIDVCSERTVSPVGKAGSLSYDTNPFFGDCTGRYNTLAAKLQPNDDKECTWLDLRTLRSYTDQLGDESNIEHIGEGANEALAGQFTDSATRTAALCDKDLFMDITSDMERICWDSLTHSCVLSDLDRNEAVHCLNVNSRESIDMERCGKKSPLCLSVSKSDCTLDIPNVNINLEGKSFTPLKVSPNSSLQPVLSKPTVSDSSLHVSAYPNRNSCSSLMPPVCTQLKHVDNNERLGVDMDLYESSQKPANMLVREPPLIDIDLIRKLSRAHRKTAGTNDQLEHGKKPSPTAKHDKNEMPEYVRSNVHSINSSGKPTDDGKPPPSVAVTSPGHSSNLHGSDEQPSSGNKQPYIGAGYATACNKMSLSSGDTTPGDDAVSSCEDKGLPPVGDEKTSAGDNVSPPSDQTADGLPPRLGDDVTAIASTGDVQLFDPIRGEYIKVDAKSGMTLSTGKTQLEEMTIDASSDANYEQNSSSGIALMKNTGKAHFFLSHGATPFLPMNDKKQPLEALSPQSTNVLDNLWKSHVDTLSSTDTIMQGGMNAGLIEAWENPVLYNYQATIPSMTDGRMQKAALRRLLLNQAYNFTRSMLHDVQVLGQVDEKFIACLMRTNESVMSPTDDGAAVRNDGHVLVLFDQHAVHERIRLEKFTADTHVDMKARQVKSFVLPMPILIALQSADKKIMKEFHASFVKLGINFSIEGTGVKVTAIPQLLKEEAQMSQATCKVNNEAVEELVKEQLQWLRVTRGTRGTLPPTLTRILASKACHGAIRFGDVLSRGECRALVRQLRDCALPFQCAHCRPDVVPLFHTSQLAALQEKRSTKPRLYMLKRRNPLLTANWRQM